MDELSADVKAFLIAHPFFQLTDTKRIKCTLNEHEFPCNLETLQNFTKGKKYKKLSSQTEFNYSQYEPHIIPSTKQPNQLFCKLTLRHINRKPHHVLKHVDGKRYKKALTQYDECKKQGIKFVPIRLQRKKMEDPYLEVQRGRKPKNGNGMWEPSGDSDESSESEDNMDDLYPPSVFKLEKPAKETMEVERCQAKDDFQTDEDENMEVDTQAVKKRKKVQGGDFKKKFKNNKNGCKKKPRKGK
ncbi:surfeit locus protein 2 [Stigmatopora nigra]